jgi:hypothetical protein
MLPSDTVATAAASGTLGTDLLASRRTAQSPADRALTGIAVTGSAVIGDSEIELMIDDVSIGHYFNSALLTPQVDRDVVGLGALGWPAGARLQAIVRDAPATSILYVMYSWEDI